MRGEDFLKGRLEDIADEYSDLILGAAKALRGEDMDGATEQSGIDKYKEEKQLSD